MAELVQANTLPMPGLPHVSPVTQEAVGGWAGYNRRQQKALFETVVVAVHQGAWQQLEARMQAALQLLPYLADDA